MPLFRPQCRGLPEEVRRVFLFGNIVSCSGRKQLGMVAPGVYGASRYVPRARGCQARHARELHRSPQEPHLHAFSRGASAKRLPHSSPDLNSAGVWNYGVVQITKTHPSQPWQILQAAAGFDALVGKIIVVVDEDVDPRDPDSVNWALSYAMQPHRDVRIITGKTPGLDPSAYLLHSSLQERSFPSPTGSSALLIDGTRKWPYPPVGLPKKEHYGERFENLGGGRASQTETPKTLVWIQSRQLDAGRRGERAAHPGRQIRPGRRKTLRTSG